MNKRAWRRLYETTATPAQIDLLYKNDMANHDADDPYCICDECMAEVLLKGTLLAADDLAKLNAPLEAS